MTESTPPDIIMEDGAIKHNTSKQYHVNVQHTNHIVDTVAIGNRPHPGDKLTSHEYHNDVYVFWFHDNERKYYIPWPQIFPGNKLTVLKADEEHHTANGSTDIEPEIVKGDVATLEVCEDAVTELVQAGTVLADAVEVAAITEPVEAGSNTVEAITEPVRSGEPSFETELCDTRINDALKQVMFGNLIDYNLKERIETNLSA